MGDFKNMEAIVETYRNAMQDRFFVAAPKLKLPTSNEDDLRARLTAVYGLAVEKHEAVFVNDCDTRRNIQMVAKWMCKPSKRGLLLYGTTGNGKTTMLLSIERLIGDCEWVEAVEIWTAARQERDGDEVRMQNYMTSPTLIIDDLGAEPEICKVYGENRYPLESVIVGRYKRQLTTIIASNLTLNQIENRYGTRMFDRMMEMYDRIVYNGPSFRRQAK